MTRTEKTECDFSHKILSNFVCHVCFIQVVAIWNIKHNMYVAVGSHENLVQSVPSEYHSMDACVELN